MAERAEVDTKRLNASTDASVWAEEFAKVRPDVDEGLMISWFANAIETAKTHAEDRYEAGYLCGLREATDALLGPVWPTSG